MTKLIALSGKRAIGISAIVDDEDFGFLNKWKWKLSDKGYAFRTTTVRQQGQPTRYPAISMGRVVASRAGVDIDTLEVDHINRNPLDNTRSNLRAATRLQNCWNMNRKTGVVGLAGVRKHRKRFSSAIRLGGGRRIHLGTFDTAEEAHAAYVKAANERSEFSPFAERLKASAERRLANEVHRAMVEGVE